MGASGCAKAKCEPLRNDFLLLAGYWHFDGAGGLRLASLQGFANGRTQLRGRERFLKDCTLSKAFSDGLSEASVSRHEKHRALETPFAKTLHQFNARDRCQVDICQYQIDWEFSGSEKLKCCEWVAQGAYSMTVESQRIGYQIEQDRPVVN
jgi:hypothetical protein